MGAASIIGVSRLESRGDRLRASALTMESVPVRIARNIDEENRAIKQPLIEGDAIACERAID